MIIKNAEVYYQGSFQKLDVKIRNNIIDTVCPKITPELDENVLESDGLLLIPGLIDIHSHGCIGYDFTTATPEEIEKMRKFYLSNGITSLLATTMTIDLPTYRKAMNNINCAMHQSSEGSHLLGINMEGPFFGPLKKGAHDARYLINPSSTIFDELDDLSGHTIRLIDIDPTLENAIPFIKKYSSCGKILSIAHTTSDYNLACEAIQAGASHITHIFNGMNDMHHRASGIIGAFSDYNVVAEMICDGIHIHPSVIRMMFKVGADKISLISDSMSAAGLSDGDYELGGQKVSVTNRKATLKDGTIAGSTITVYDALKNVIAFGIPREQAILSVTLIPARSIHMEDTIGSIEPGKQADLILTDQEFQLKSIIQSGQFIM